MGIKVKARYVVCGQESGDEPWMTIRDDFKTRQDAADWLSSHHRIAECEGYTAFYVDRDDNEGQADEYYTRLPDGSLAHDNHGHLTAFAD